MALILAPFVIWLGVVIRPQDRRRDLDRRGRGPQGRGPDRRRRAGHHRGRRPRGPPQGRRPPGPGHPRRQGIPGNRVVTIEARRQAPGRRPPRKPPEVVRVAAPPAPPLGAVPVRPPPAPARSSKSAFTPFHMLRGTDLHHRPAPPPPWPPTINWPRHPKAPVDRARRATAMGDARPRPVPPVQPEATKGLVEAVNRYCPDWGAMVLPIDGRGRRSLRLWGSRAGPSRRFALQLHPGTSGWPFVDLKFTSL